jgi:hypothetical protein
MLPVCSRIALDVITYLPDNWLQLDLCTILKLLRREADVRHDCTAVAPARTLW